jgi:hypothetical protein
MKASKIFISYTHDSESHMNRVFELSERLRSDGVDSNIDQYEVSPPEGWPAWMRRQIKEAHFVLVICSENYLRRYERSEELGKGAGAKWEGGIISQELYEAEGTNTKFIPVVLTAEDVKYIPVEMRGGTHYVLDSDARYDDLYGHITEQPKTVKRELGELRQLPPTRAQRTVGSKPVETVLEPSPVIPHESVRSQHPLVVLMQPGGSALFVRAQRIRASGKLVSLSILPSDPRQIAAISELERNSREPIGIAYNLTALFVRLKSIEQIIEKEEVWHLELEEDEYATRGGSIEFSMTAYPPDQIAELRARRILFDEKLDPAFGGRGDLNRQLLETSLQGGYDSKFAITHSPLPELFAEFNAKDDEFSEAARLYSVLLLLLTHTVSQILRLDLEMRSDGTLAVDFEGARPPRYSNEEPPVIRVNGACKLR